MGIDLVGVDLVGVDLVGVDFVGVDFVGGHRRIVVTSSLWMRKRRKGTVKSCPALVYLSKTTLICRQTMQDSSMIWPPGHG